MPARPFVAGRRRRRTARPTVDASARYRGQVTCVAARHFVACQLCLLGHRRSPCQTAIRIVGLRNRRADFLTRDRAKEGAYRRILRAPLGIQQWSPEIRLHEPSSNAAAARLWTLVPFSRIRGSFRDARLGPSAVSRRTDHPRSGAPLSVALPLAVTPPENDRVSARPASDPTLHIPAPDPGDEPRPIASTTWSACSPTAPSRCHWAISSRPRPICDACTAGHIFRPDEDWVGRRRPIVVGLTGRGPCRPRRAPARRPVSRVLSRGCAAGTVIHLGRRLPAASAADPRAGQRRPSPRPKPRLRPPIWPCSG